MVYVEADETPEQRVCLAASLADQFSATLIGVSSLAIPPPIVADGMVMDELTEVDIELMKVKLADKGNWFRRIAGNNHRKLEWRTALDFPARFVTREARSADLIVIGRVKASGGSHKALDPGEAILKMGRPTLVIPEGVSSLRGEHIVIGWKDTREARRAVRDALPFLQRVTGVTIAEACGSDEERVYWGADDGSLPKAPSYQSWVLRHAERKGSGAAQLLRVAQEERADLWSLVPTDIAARRVWISRHDANSWTQSPIACIKADFAAPHHISRDGDGYGLQETSRGCASRLGHDADYRHTKKHDPRRGWNGARLRGSGGVFDLRCGARIYSRICLSRVARRRRQRCDGVRDRQPLLRASRSIAASDHRGQAQLHRVRSNFAPWPRSSGASPASAWAVGRASNLRFLCSISICPDLVRASGRCTPLP
jgi:hypothetical protein